MRSACILVGEKKLHTKVSWKNKETRFDDGAKTLRWYGIGKRESLPEENPVNGGIRRLAGKTFLKLILYEVYRFLRKYVPWMC